MPNGPMLAAALAAIAYLLIPPAAADVYRCKTDRGVPLFSQYPCATSGRAEIVTIAEPSVMATAELTIQEQAVLDGIQRRSKKNASKALRNQQRARRRNAQLRARQREQCRHARSALKHLREQKRGGYGLAKAKRLDAREAELKAALDAYC